MLTTTAAPFPHPKRIFLTEPPQSVLETSALPHCRRARLLATMRFGNQCALLLKPCATPVCRESSLPAHPCTSATPPLPDLLSPAPPSRPHLQLSITHNTIPNLPPSSLHSYALSNTRPPLPSMHPPIHTHTGSTSSAPHPRRRSRADVTIPARLPEPSRLYRIHEGGGGVPRRADDEMLVAGGGVRVLVLLRRGREGVAAAGAVGEFGDAADGREEPPSLLRCEGIEWLPVARVRERVRGHGQRHAQRALENVSEGCAGGPSGPR